MITKIDIENTIEQQTNNIHDEKTLSRDLLKSVKPAKGFATIITGIRRCGKSTVVGQLQKKAKGSLYINFDTPALFGFSMDNFRLLDMIIQEHKAKKLFLDEIQVVNGWEVYVRGKLDEGYEVMITGSNASLLSKELGTKLTGRHISKTLYPFSYGEFCKFKKIDTGVASFEKYLQLGGFPQFLKEGNDEILQNLVSDILYRDIMVRFGLKEDLPLKKLILFLMGNIGNPVSANSLRDVIGVKGTQTVLDYFSYLENAYLMQFVPQFSYSYRTQQLRPKKVYSIDLGLHSAMSPSFSKDLGHKLENAVYLELVQRGNNVFYFNESNCECDFVACNGNEPENVIQVCYDFNPENYNREITGLVKAMNFFKLKEGLLLTLTQTDELVIDGKQIHVRPAWRWAKERSN